MAGVQKHTPGCSCCTPTAHATFSVSVGRCLNEPDSATVEVLLGGVVVGSCTAGPGGSGGVDTCTVQVSATGSYTIRTTAPGYATASTTSNVATLFNQTIFINLSPTLTTGRVNLTGNACTTTSCPIHSSATLTHQTTGLTYTGSSGALTTYTIKNLPPGTYDIVGVCAVAGYSNYTGTVSVTASCTAVSRSMVFPTPADHWCLHGPTQDCTKAKPGSLTVTVKGFGPLEGGIGMTLVPGDDGQTATYESACTAYSKDGGSGFVKYGLTLRAGHCTDSQPSGPGLQYFGRGDDTTPGGAGPATSCTEGGIGFGIVIFGDGTDTTTVGTVGCPTLFTRSVDFDPTNIFFTVEE